MESCPTSQSLHISQVHPTNFFSASENISTGSSLLLEVVEEATRTFLASGVLLWLDCFSLGDEVEDIEEDIENFLVLKVSEPLSEVYATVRWGCVGDTVHRGYVGDTVDRGCVEDTVHRGCLGEIVLYWVDFLLLDFFGCVIWQPSGIKFKCDTLDVSDIESPTIKIENKLILFLQ